MGEPTQTRSARTIVIDLVCIGAEWAAISPELPGGKMYGDCREDVKEAARENLGPAVRLEFREVGTLPRHPDERAQARRRDNQVLVSQDPQGTADRTERNPVLLGEGSLSRQSRARRQGAVTDAGLDVFRQLDVSVGRAGLQLEITCCHTGNLEWSLPARIRRTRLIVVHRVIAR